MTQKIAEILGVRININRKDELLKTILSASFGERKRRGGGLVVFTPNPEFLVEANRDKDFNTLLNKADINLPDGVGLVWAGRILGQRIYERVSGADVVESIFNQVSERKGASSDGEEEFGGYKVGIVGARRGEIKEVRELLDKLRTRYPKISFESLDLVCEEAKTKKFNLILACQGMKKQEEWIWKNKEKIRANVYIGVGGSLDFLTGFTKRAPVWMRKLGLEWFWRGLQRPAHFKRIWKALVVFGWLVIREKLKIG